MVCLWNVHVRCVRTMTGMEDERVAIYMSAASAIVKRELEISSAGDPSVEFTASVQKVQTTEWN